MRVVDILMKQVGKDCDVTFLVQPVAEEEIRNKYPFAEVISIQDAYFEYTSFFKNVTLNKMFDTVYVLSSGESFWGYEEIFLIADQIKCRKLIFFNGKGESNAELQNFYSVVADNVFSFFERMITFWYKNWGKKYRF